MPILRRSILGPYEATRCIGSGAYGTVYLACDLRDDTQCCLKQIHMLEDASERHKRHARDEIALLKSLSHHPGIVAYRDSFVNPDDGSLCLVMDYCEGGDLAHCLRRQREELGAFGDPVHFSEHVVLDWFIEMALSLDYVHSRRVLHRDLKTNNVFLTRDGRLRLGDFGIAKALEGTVSEAASCVGTPSYMPPEVCEGETYDYKADVWSLGCILYELMALRPCWRGDNFLAVVYAICKKEPPPLPSGLYSPELLGLVGEMLCKDPRGRPSLAQILQRPLIRQRLQACPPPADYLTPARQHALLAAGHGHGHDEEEEEEDTDMGGEVPAAVEVHAPTPVRRRKPLAQGVTEGWAKATDLLRRGWGEAGAACRALGKGHRRRPSDERWTDMAAAESAGEEPEDEAEAEAGPAAAEAILVAVPGEGEEDEEEPALGETLKEYVAGAAEQQQAMYHYLDGHGEQRGPVDEEMLMLLHVLGEIDDSTMVWREGLEQWACMGHLPELRATRGYV